MFNVTSHVTLQYYVHMYYINKEQTLKDKKNKNFFFLNESPKNEFRKNFSKITRDDPLIRVSL